MKKISTTLCMLAFSSMMLNAAVVKNETTSAEYATLQEAWNEAADGDVLILNENAEITSRLNSGAKHITIKGASNVTISKADSYNGILILANKDNKGGSITLENLTIDGKGNMGGNNALQANGGTLNLNNITITNCETSNNQGVISIKGGSKLNATNLSVTNSNVTFADEKRGQVFAGSNDVSFSGTCNFSAYAEKQLHFNCANLTGGKITLIYNKDRELTSSIVNGTENTNLFTVEGTDYELTANTGNIYFKEKGSDVTYPALNETTNTGYMSLAAAWDAAANGDVIVLNEDATISGRLGGSGRQFTLKGNGHTISRAAGFPNNTLMFLTNVNTGNITLENVVIDGTNTNSTNTTIETSGNSTLNLNNVTFINCSTSNGQGVISVKNGGKLNINSVKTQNCDLPAGAGDVFCGTNNVSVAGNCTLSVFLQNDNYFTATDLTDGLITILFDTAGTRDLATKPFVIGNDNTALFKSGDSNYDLKVAEGNIMLEKNELSSVVEGISNDEAQIMDVYSIQGVRLKAGVAAAEATEGLPAGLYIVGGKKVIVK